MYYPAKLKLRPNVPPALAAETRKILAGYYAHCTALDDCMGELMAALRETGLADNTILVFSADHGEMLGWPNCICAGQAASLGFSLDLTDLCLCAAHLL